MKATIRLTPKQFKALEPLFAAVNKAANKSTRANNQRGSVLGQAWEDGSAEFNFLPHESAQIVGRAIRRVLKPKKEAK